MSKRSTFKKVEKDFYPTIDPNAIPYTFIDLIRGKSYADTCYGNGDLEDLLMDIATCKWRSDIRATVGSSKVMDALQVSEENLKGIDCFIQNPPFTRKVLDPLLDHWLSFGKPVWLLLPADYMHNITFGKYMEVCSCVVSVGRLYWFLNEQVNMKPIKWDSLPEWARKFVCGSDAKIGVYYYTGWWDTLGDKPAKTKYTRGTDNYAWFCFESDATETKFIGRYSK